MHTCENIQNLIQWVLVKTGISLTYKHIGHLHTHRNKHILLHAKMHAHTCIHIVSLSLSHAHIHTNKCITHTCTHTHTHAHARTRTHTHISSPISMPLCNQQVRSSHASHRCFWTVHKYNKTHTHTQNTAILY